MLSRLLHGERLAVGENRAVETVLLVIGVDEEDGSLLYGVYDFVAYLFRQGGTAETAAEPARRVQERFRTVIRAVDDDGPFICLVVDARFAPEFARILPDAEHLSGPQRLFAEARRTRTGHQRQGI